LRDDQGGVYRMTGICTDVTDRVKADEELRRALHLAQEAGRARDRFLAMLSHELRTPLTPVVLATEEMLESPNLPEEYRESIAMIRRNVALEVRLIEDLLDVSRVIRGKMNVRLETISGHALVRQVLEICKPDAEAKRLRLEAHLGATCDTLRADPARFQQILWNLLKNGVKFTPLLGRVRVVTRSEEGWFIVEVSDTGPGIEPSALGRIFQPFEQAEGVGTRNDGLGLGLAISRSIAEAHGGSLEATEVGMGEGASFTLRLPTFVSEDPPTLPPGEGAPRFAEAARRPTPGLHVLLVEDEPMTARVMERMLRHHGYEVSTASTVAEALNVPAASIDVVISDISLPDGDGLELMRRLRESIDVPGIALSGFGTEEDRGRSREAGFVEHIVKPVDFSRLAEAIHRVARRPTEDRPSEPVERAEPCPAGSPPELSPTEN
ncbi:MAG: ATP-binding protein, partial [Isosphaeraceae bacterium]